jgi:hypothetical protein
MSEFALDILKGVLKSLLTTAVLAGLAYLAYLLPFVQKIFFSDWKIYSIFLLTLVVFFLFWQSVKNRKCIIELQSDVESLRGTSSKTANKSHVKKVKESLKKEFQDIVDDAKKELSRTLEAHENRMKSMEGDIYRTLAHFWDSQESYSVAFVWWIRAAKVFSAPNVDEQKLARIALTSAKESAEKIKYGFSLTTEFVGEYQEIVKQVPDEYKIEKDLLDSAVKDALARKPAPVAATSHINTQ